jgi:5'-phosphate synthase pdxT subunit
VSPSRPIVGVLALQGGFARHAIALARLGCDAPEVRTPAQLAAVDALVVPGGESTTLAKLLDSSGLRDPLRLRLEQGLPVLGTCAGMILLASGIEDGRGDQWSFSAIDLAVRRNGYGRQFDSFEADLDVAGLDTPFHAVFIRAPRVVRVGPAVEVLATVDGDAVLCRQGAVTVACFHPELTDDLRLHEQFVAGVAAGRGATPVAPAASA